MLNRRKKAVTSRISIDPGGFHTRIFSETDGLVLAEPSTGLLNMDHQHAGARAVSHYGLAAKRLIEKNPPGMRLIRPLQSDEVNNAGHWPKMLAYFLSLAKNQGLTGKSPIVLLALPNDSTQLQTEQLRHACFTAGASRVHLVDNGIAMALGAGLQIDHPEASALIDFGARSARLYVYANDEIVYSSEIPCGGDLLDQHLSNGIREQFGIQVSEATATDTKHRIGSALPARYDHRLRNSCQVTGLAIDENFDTQFGLTTEIACEMLQPAMQQAKTAITAAVNALPAHLHEQLRETGITLCGGGAQLAQIDQLVMEAADLPVDIAHRPMSVAARGGGIMLERIHGSLDLKQHQTTADPV